MSLLQAMGIVAAFADGLDAEKLALKRKLVASEARITGVPLLKQKNNTLLYKIKQDEKDKINLRYQ